MRRYKYLVVWICFFLSVACYLFVLPLAATDRKSNEHLFTLPPRVLRLVSFQFKEVFADIYFLNALTFIGGTRTRSDTKLYTTEQYAWIYGSLANSAALDPFFIDPYNLMNSALVWDKYEIAEVNGLIAKGAETRYWDHLLAYFAGFNYYYFLNDGDNSFKYLKVASARSGGNPFYDSLAARVAYKSNKTDVAILYLEHQIRQAEAEGKIYTVKPLFNRLNVLKGIRQVEVGVEAYKKTFGKVPSSITELVTLKFVDTIPVEPNGGSYFLDPDGIVKSTKELK
jgi:hypothetical protein